MYAFRKPFTVATFEDVDGWTLPVDFKILMVLSQVIGYATSKFIGIKVVSEATPRLRALLIILFILFAWSSLVLFAILPTNLKFIALFFNGLPLGMIWGLVFAYLEGRKISEVLGLGLCVSFIVSSGSVKSVGQLLMMHGVSEMWMPAITGLVFLPLLGIAVYFLSKVPPPNELDKAERQVRLPMTRKDRLRFFKRSSWGLVALIIAFVALTVTRDFRDNFAAEIWSSIGYGNIPGIFTYSELIVAFVVLILMAGSMLIRENKNAVLVQHGIILAGGMVTLLSTLLFQIHIMNPITWMIMIGIGLYMAYVPFNCILIDRLTGAMKMTANAGFFMYLADSSGYAGSVILLIFKSFVAIDLSWLDFFIDLSYISSITVMCMTVFSFFYFNKKLV
jgi:MFS family permease